MSEGNGQRDDGAARTIRVRRVVSADDDGRAEIIRLRAAHEESLRRVKVTIAEARRRAAADGVFLRPAEMASMERTRAYQAARVQDLNRQLSEVNQLIKRRRVADHGEQDGYKARMKEALRRIADGAPDPVRIATEALGPYCAETTPPINALAEHAATAGEVTP